MIALGLFATAGIGLFFGLPTLLIAAPQRSSADIILHAAIDPHSGSDAYVAELYRQGVARKIVCVSSQVSWEVYPGDYAREHLISMGIPAEDVLSLRLPITDCSAAGLTSVIEYLKAHGWKSVLLVGHPEGSRYDGWLGRRLFNLHGMNLAATYAPEDKIELTTRWWRTHWKVQRFVQEAMNIAIDLLYPECR